MPEEANSRSVTTSRGGEHIHDVIELHRLPLIHTTLRRGSPQTLVLTKQKALFERDAELRARQKVLFAWLKTQRSAFADTRQSVASS
ncbi:hypothetical protein [Sorangium sp. So ce1078]|uniref:hypothetical protein n=1 Tax=Sorangium sp. So ce1078 TaxID=3133329 RepID=UPI003F5FE424